jgi:hypothetical protein
MSKQVLAATGRCIALRATRWVVAPLQRGISRIERCLHGHVLRVPRGHGVPVACARITGPALRALIVGILGLGAASGVSAQGAYEPFDYPSGSNLAGANGGSGFSEAWRVTASGPTSVVTGAQSGTIVDGLTYVDALGQSLPVSGRAWQTSSALSFGQGQRGTTASFGAAGTSVWMSFLVRQATTTAGVSYAVGSPGTGFGFGSGAMAAGVFRVPEAGYTAFYDGGGRSGDIGNAAGRVTLVVMRVDFAASGNDTLRVWFNPLLNRPLGSPDQVGAIDNYAASINGATLAWGDTRSFVYDEMRIGTEIGWTVEATADAYEPFDYPLGGNLHNAKGGEGFDGPWTVTQTGPSNIVTGAASGEIVAGLAYPGLVTAGNAVRTSTQVIAGQAQRLTRRSFGSAGSTTWLSFLVRQDSTAGPAANYAMATPGVGFATGAAAMVGGRAAPPNALICGIYSSTECTTGVALPGAPGDVTFVVLRIDFATAGANDTMRAWINPVVGQSLGPPQLTGAFRDYASLFGGLSLVWGDQRSFVFDEVRIGIAPNDWLFDDSFE